MKRAIATSGLIFLLSASLLFAAENGAPAVTTRGPAGLCVASTPTNPGQLDFPTPDQRTTCSAVAYCADGSQVSCSSGTWDLCETYYACSYPYAECGVRCLNNFRFCPGYNYSTCSC